LIYFHLICANTLNTEFSLFFGFMLSCKLNHVFNRGHSSIHNASDIVLQSLRERLGPSIQVHALFCLNLASLFSPVSRFLALQLVVHI
jgi:hypothetical protein